MAPWRALPAVLLAAHAVGFGWLALGRGALAYDDHPGQLYRLAHALTLGLAPWRWNPGWWAGYAELQYYPPGAFALGVLLDRATLGRLEAEAVYCVLLWVAWLLPGVSTYALLRRVVADRWVAAMGGFFALAISAETRSGVEEGLRWGLIAARIGWGLMPLLLLSLLRWLDRGPAPLMAIVVLSAVILTHPAHAPGALLAIAIAAMLGAGSRERRLGGAALITGLGLGLASLWLMPLLARLWLSFPLAWGEASLAALGGRFVRYPLLSLLALGSMIALWPSRPGGLAGPARYLAWLAPTSVALVALDSVMATALTLQWLPADRVADTAVLALIVAGAIGLDRCLTGLGSRLRVPGRVVALAAVLALSGGRPEPALTLWPEARHWPTEAELTRGLRLSELWAALRQAPPGRVLVLPSAVPLEWRPEWWRPHSHVLALTPLRAGREIVGGTFTHPSPVAAFFYMGARDHRPIDTLAEQRDGVTLFGRPLTELGSEEFETRMRRLGVSTVISLDRDEGRLGFLGRDEVFRLFAAIGPFRLRASAPVPLPRPAGPGHLVIDGGPGSDGWLRVPVAYSPLWKARAAGASLATRHGEMGLLEVKEPSTPDRVDLVYGPGRAEVAGATVSLGSLAALGIIAWRRRRGAPPGSRPRA